MANKTLGTRQKLSLRVEPSQKLARARNPVAIAARLRAAGPHRKSASGVRQEALRELRRHLGKPDPE